MDGLNKSRFLSSIKQFNSAGLKEVTIKNSIKLDDESKQANDQRDASGNELGYESIIRSIDKEEQAQLSMSTLCQDLNFLIRRELSLRTNALLGLTSKANLAIYQNAEFYPNKFRNDWMTNITSKVAQEELFREHPEKRLSALLVVDSIGMNYLANRIGIENCTTLNMRKIAEGALTIDQFLEPVESRPDELLPIDQIGRDYLKNVRGLDCGPNTMEQIMRKEKTVQEAKQSRDDFRKQLGKPGNKQRYTMDPRLRFKQNSACQKYEHDGGMQPQQLIKEEIDRHPINLKEYQKQIDSLNIPMTLVYDLPIRDIYPLQYKGVGMLVNTRLLDPKTAINLSDKTCQDLDDPVIYFHLNNKHISLSLFLTLNDDQVERLKDARLCNLISRKALTLDEILKTTDVSLKDLYALGKKRKKENQAQEQINEVTQHSWKYATKLLVKKVGIGVQA